MSIDAQILAALRDHPEGVSGADLSHRLHITRAAIWARIEALRQLGYEVEAGPHRGYRLIASPDLLHADDLHARLGKVRVVGREIHVFAQTTSTNDVVEKLARDGVREGAVVFAEAQSRGRGRLGRRWISPARKGLWFSVLLRPDLRPQQATQLTVAGATALARAIEHVGGLTVEIKWPNDILSRGKKLAGILTELSAEVDHIKHVILGIGIDVNVSEFSEELRKIATSLRLETGRVIDRAHLAASILRELDEDYQKIRKGQFETVAAEWEERCTTIGHNVSIRVGDRVLAGRAESLDNEGALLLRTQHGHLERIIGGDVTLEK